MPKFVIQKHSATTLHYDFRLQIGNILKSWVIPKAFSLNPKDKRLAVQTKDHELDFANFEGSIPSGEYGAGIIIVWDTGSYENQSRDHGEKISIQEAFKNGKITFFLNGNRIKGLYSLVKIKTNDWLLVKHNDEYSSTENDPLKDMFSSIISGKTLEDFD